jgi:hypothetical protein
MIINSLYPQLPERKSASRRLKSKGFNKNDRRLPDCFLEDERLRLRGRRAKEGRGVKSNPLVRTFVLALVLLIAANPLIGYNSTTPAVEVTPWIPEISLEAPIETAGNRGPVEVKDWIYSKARQDSGPAKECKDD